MDSNRPISSFWGNVSYMQQTAAAGKVKVVIASGHELLLDEADPGLPFIRVTSGAKMTFLVLCSPESASSPQVLAVYNHPKADHRLVLSLRQLIASGRMTKEDLSDWDPDYMRDG